MPSVLIVDDEPENLKSLKRFLEDRDATLVVSTASNEAEALAILNGTPPDVIISDLVMTTDQGGMEVLVQAKLKDPLIMVILITAFEKKLERYRAFELGAFDCVQKNVPGVIAAEEILVKTKAAIRFRDLARQQVENERRLTFLKRYFDPRVFGTIEQNPELLNVANRVLTICFWDIRGFSLLCEILKAHPTLISGFLREYFKASAEVIFDHGGVLDKYIGDGVMAIFGALNGHTDEQCAIDAVNASVQLRRRFAQLLKPWKEQWALYTPQQINIGLGCGLHTGEALVGNVGTDMRDHYTALGPNVNFAQRLESRAAKGQILVSASTEQRIRGHFAMEAAGMINDVKNMPGDFPIFSVVAPE